jgi:membrane fusion protein (multidrug efflux system)
MDAKVDVRQTDGRMLAEGSRAGAGTQTSVFDQDNAAADAQVRKIIAANSGRLAKPEVAVGARRAAPANAAAAAASSSSAIAAVATVAASTVVAVQPPIDSK